VLETARGNGYNGIVAKRHWKAGPRVSAPTEAHRQTLGEVRVYAKIFAQIFDSSISQDYLTRLVFMDLLVLADEHGVVDITTEAISRRTNVPIEIVSESIAKLSQPDPKSRTPDEEGRRIILLDAHRDWGWQIVNYPSYRQMRNNKERTAYFREYKRKKRAGVDIVDNCGHGVDNVDSTTTASASVVVSSKRSIPKKESSFPIFWKRYAKLRNVGEDEACRVWLSFDCDEWAPSLFDCLESYENSRDVANGAVMNGERWLASNARSGWKSRWAPPSAKAEQLTEADLYLKQLQEKPRDRPDNGIVPGGKVQSAGPVPSGRTGDSRARIGAVVGGNGHARDRSNRINPVRAEDIAKASGNPGRAERLPG